MSLKNINEELRRFCNFDDAVVESFAIEFPNKRKIGKGKIVLEARDCTSGVKNAWFKVTLEIEGISEFRLTENSRCYNRVLSSGLKVQQIDNRLWIIFDQEDPVSSVDEARRSQFYLCGTECRTQKTPISV